MPDNNQNQQPNTSPPNQASSSQANSAQDNSQVNLDREHARPSDFTMPPQTPSQEPNSTPQSPNPSQNPNQSSDPNQSPASQPPTPANSSNTKRNLLDGLLGGFKMIFDKKGKKGKSKSKKKSQPNQANSQQSQTQPNTQNQSTAQQAQPNPQQSTHSTTTASSDSASQSQNASAMDMTIKDVIAPPSLEVDFNHVQVGDRYYRTLFASGYPRFVGPNWLAPLINFEHSLMISTFYYPVDSKDTLQKLKRKISEMQASMYGEMEKGKVLDPSTKIALKDAQKLQEAIAEGTEKFFHFAMYITISANSKERLEKITNNVTSTLAAINIIAKPATLQMEQALYSTLPSGNDQLHITRNMDTTSLATTFPFVTSELTMDHGILYGLNMHNRSLIIFDRFEMENANSVIFAKSGAGKSYLVKLEALRSLMLGTEILIIDPEKEFERLCEAVNGAYITFSQDQGSKINPFELSGLGDPDEDELRMKILSLHGFFKVLFGGLSNIESSILDRALILTYRERGITTDPDTQKNADPPLLEDLYKILKGMAEPEGREMAKRLEKYIIGSAAGVFNEKSNVEISNPFTVFSLRDLQEELRPMAMYLMLDYIWTKVKRERKRRLLLVDEAWLMMQNEDSAKFVYSIAKRARKYYLGLTTITQDVEDFLDSDYGKAIVTNSSIQILLKQSSAAVDRIQKVFNLSDGEKQFLLQCERGEGLFFAGSHHVAINVISSMGEHLLITSDPREVEAMHQSGLAIDQQEVDELSQVFDPMAAKKTLASRKREAQAQQDEAERQNQQAENPPQAQQSPNPGPTQPTENNSQTQPSPNTVSPQQSAIDAQTQQKAGTTTDTNPPTSPDSADINPDSSDTNNASSGDFPDSRPPTP
jgi:hypothetical protein